MANVINTPKVTVLMPVYNGEKYLREAIASILNQTYTNFEFLIINDGSNDKTPEIINSYRDSRIKVVDNKTNKKLIYSLNLGLALARGKYIARMDADDISLPNRLERQIGFLEAHPEVGICSSWTKLFSDRNMFKRVTLSFPTDPDAIQCALLFENVIQHPAAVFRSEFIHQHRIRYPHLLHVEDYALWLQASRLTKLAIIGQVLLLYRLHPGRIGEKYAELQKVNVAKLHLAELKRLGLNPTTEELSIHEKICRLELNINHNSIDQIEDWLLKLKLVNGKTKYYPSKFFNRELFKRWLSICLIVLSQRRSITSVLWRSALTRGFAISPRAKVALTLARVVLPFFALYLPQALDTTIRKYFARIIVESA